MLHLEGARSARGLALFAVLVTSAVGSARFGASSNSSAARFGPTVDGGQEIVHVSATGSLRVLSERNESTSDVTAALGLDGVADVGFVRAHDVDGDEFTDLFVGTTRGPSRLFVRRGGTFVETTETSGLGAVGRDVDARFLDFDRDGLIDLHVGRTSGHTLYRGLGGGRFERVDWPVASFPGASLPSARVVPGAGLQEDIAETPTGAEVGGVGGPSFVSGGGSTLSPVDAFHARSSSGTQAATALFGCVNGILDRSGGPCLTASSVPMLGALHPQDGSFSVQAGTGRVGIGTTLPTADLDVAGQAVSGVMNDASAAQSAIGGGRLNVASGDQATIAGGDGNAVVGLAGAVGGGTANSALSQRAAIGGGIGNRAAYRAFVGGGSNNGALGNVTAVAGGKLNEAQQTGDFVGGGEENIANGSHATVLGGRSNDAGPNAAIAGGQNQLADGAFAFVGGGGDDVDPLLGNRASGAHATVGGGSENAVLGSSDYDTIGGGRQNVIDHAVVGQANLIGGGEGNDITSTSAGASASAILGGLNNSIPDASWAVIGGGSSNVASGLASTVGGGEENMASGDHATVPGGRKSVAAGDFSFATGRRAKALDDGVFVFADATKEDFVSTGVDQFLVRAEGGVGINTNTPTSALTVAGTIESRGGSGAFVFPNGSQQTTAASGFLTAGTAVPLASDVAPAGFEFAARTVATLLSENTWSSTASPGWPDDRFGTAVGNQIHVIGGWGSDEHRVYSIASDSWSNLDPIPTSGQGMRGGAACAELNGDLYVAGGFASLFTFDDVVRYDGSWVTVGSDPAGGRYFHAAAVAQGKLYLLGGVGLAQTPLDNVTEYDPVAGTLTPRASLPTARYGMAVATLGGEIYVLGGDSTWPPGSGTVATVNVYDPVTNTWSTKAPLPSAASDFAACEWNGRIFTIEPAFEYTSTFDFWSSQIGPPATLNQGQFTAVIDGEQFAIGKSAWKRGVQPTFLDLVVPE